jgi:hypothetical protein
MAKTKKRPATKRPAKTKAKASAKKVTKRAAAKKPAKKQAPAKAKVAPKKKAGGGSTPARPAPVKGLDEEAKKPTVSKAVPGIVPKEPDLDEEIADDEIDISSEGEIEEDMEEDLTLDDDDEEDVDYLEKSEDLLDDSDDYRH